MTSLYGRLFGYSARQDRKPLENFLTECLCDVLERITIFDRKLLEDIVDVLLDKRTPQSFITTLSNAEVLHWETQRCVQFSGSRGYLDLCLIANGKRIILVIENKIGAGFTTHWIPDNSGELMDDEKEQCGQLSFYKKFLAENTKHAALILLTHRSDPPAEFALAATDQGEISEGAVFCRVCRWIHVHAWLTEQLANPFCFEAASQDGYVLGALIRELAQFLEEQHMTTAETSMRDLDLIAQLFDNDLLVKLKDMMSTTRDALLKGASLAAIGYYGGPKAYLDKQTPVIWDWVYCSERDLKWFIAWGISGAEGLANYFVTLPNRVQCFVLVGSDGQEIRIPADITCVDEKEWTVLDPCVGSKSMRIFKCIEPHRLLGENTSFNTSFESWIAKAVDEGALLLKSALDERDRKTEGR